MPKPDKAPSLTAAGAAVRNPLSVIAMFVLLVEVIATVTLVQVLPKDHIAVPIAWFVVIFPTLIAFLFFGTIWWRHQFLYSPYEYRSDESFLSAMQRLEKVEARQDAAALNPEIADEEHSFTVVDRLLKVNDLRGAVGVGRTFLEAGQAQEATNIFQHVIDGSNPAHPDRYKAFANLAYAEIQASDFDAAIESLESAMEAGGERGSRPWHLLASAYAHKRLSSASGDEHDLKAMNLIDKAKKHPKSFEKSFFRNLYPEIAEFLQ